MLTISKRARGCIETRYKKGRLVPHALAWAGVGGDVRKVQNKSLHNLSFIHFLKARKANKLKENSQPFHSLLSSSSVHTSDRGIGVNIS